MFEFTLVLKEKGKYKPIVRTVIDELCYFAILFMQITDDQVRFHSLSFNVFNNTALIHTLLTGLQGRHVDAQSRAVCAGRGREVVSYSFSVRISAQKLIEVIIIPVCCFFLVPLKKYSHE